MTGTSCCLNRGGQYGNTRILNTQKLNREVAGDDGGGDDDDDGNDDVDGE